MKLTQRITTCLFVCCFPLVAQSDSEQTSHLTVADVIKSIPTSCESQESTELDLTFQFYCYSNGSVDIFVPKIKIQNGSFDVILKKINDIIVHIKIIDDHGPFCDVMTPKKIDDRCVYAFNVTTYEDHNLSKISGAVLTPNIDKNYYDLRIFGDRK